MFCYKLRIWSFNRRGGAKLLKNLALKGPVRCVAYCTIGKRSGDFCVATSKLLFGDTEKELKKESLENAANRIAVYNLAGSLIAWTHEGYDLVVPQANSMEIITLSGQSDSEVASAALQGAEGPSTKEVHAFGKQWAAVVPEGYNATFFGSPTSSYVSDKLKRLWSKDK